MVLNAAGYISCAHVIGTDRFADPFTGLAETGVHTGLHGSVIENVDVFVVEVFEDIEI
jgi:hypothetical protein